MKKNKFIPIAEPCIGKKELQYVLEAVRSGWVGAHGKFIAIFEERFAEFIGVPYAISTSSGTAALHLAVLSLGIGRGDEVIIPNLTYIATANAVTYTGAKPVFVDSSPHTWCINPSKIEERITSKTKAIIAVHLYGHPANMDFILKIARKHKLFVIEDAAQAHGAVYQGHMAGSMGDLGVFSFYGNKIITTGEGGMVTTKNKDIADKVFLYKTQGVHAKNKCWHSVVGYNYRMTNIQAALGTAQLERIEEFIFKKRQVFSWYKNNLGAIAGITLNDEASSVKSVFWSNCIVLNPKIITASRDEIMERLLKKGIETRPFFYRVTDLPPYKRKSSDSVSLYLSKNGFCLPSSVNLQEPDIQRIVRALRQIIGFKRIS